MFILRHILILFFVFLCKNSSAQNVSLYSQFNGSFDFTFIGNSMNMRENNITDGCTELLNQSSSAVLQLSNNQIIEKAYLYWAGSGNEDQNVSLNGQNIASQRSFTWTSASGLNYFSSFADVTNQISVAGNGTYTLSNLDVSQALLQIPEYCNNRTNFAGWAIIVIYKDVSLPINQINVYDGLQGVPNSLSITLNNLNVIDNLGSKIGLIAWEGDSNLPTETLTLNGNVISNSVNPPDNVFNGTNSINGENTPNMDLDIYDIQGNINIGDTSAQINLTSYQDVVMINAVVTKLNTKLPDATIGINNITQTCNSRTIVIDFTVYNTNGTIGLPSQTPIAVYVNNILTAQTATAQAVPNGESWNNTISIEVPENNSNSFTIAFVIDDNGTGQGIITELDESNNNFLVQFSFWELPVFNVLEPIEVCNEGLTSGTFSFQHYANLVLANNQDTFGGFFETLQDAQTMNNPILNTTQYIAQQTPKEIFVRIDNNICYSITSFMLNTQNCFPHIYNYISSNDDQQNDYFVIEGLEGIFLNFKLNIYNRWGTMVWENSRSDIFFRGLSNKGFSINKELPEGTYYYILNLNDNKYPNPIIGWIYLDR